MAEKSTNTFETIAWEVIEKLPTSAPWDDTQALADPLIKDIEKYGVYEEKIWQIIEG